MSQNTDLAWRHISWIWLGLQESGVEVRHLRYFVRIVEDGSVSRASVALHIAQPALSKQVRQLEGELGVKLLARSVRGVTATEAGLAVYRHAKAVLKQIDATLSVATQAGGGVVGQVGIGLPWTISSLLGLSLIAEVRATLPLVRLEISEGPSAEISRMLSQGKLDLAVVFGARSHAALRVQPMVAESLWLVGAQGSLEDRDPCGLEEAASLPLLLMSRPNGIREEIERIWAAKGIAPNVVADVNAPGLLIESVQAGLGYGILPSCAFDQKLRKWRIDAVELGGEAPRRIVCLATSMLFPISLAAQRVHDILERLMRSAVEDGRWQAVLFREDASFARLP
jgi:DNA-binding transcriptional LysR family regulator